MNVVDKKRKQINLYIKKSGYSKSEIARRLGKTAASFINNLRQLKRMESLEKIEKQIKEVIK